MTRPGNHEQDSPEALMISALLASGSFDPQTHGLGEADLECWHKLWRFCAEYQEQSGQAPALDLVHLQAPDFVFTPHVERGWAAYQLHRENSSRRLRKTIRKALHSLNDDDVDGAYDELDKLERPRGARRRSVSALDYVSPEEFEITRIQSPYPSLNRVTKGIGPGDLWYWAARPQHGKSMNLCLFAAQAARDGVQVGYCSLEMPASQIGARILRMLSSKADRKVLDSNDPHEVKKLVERVKAKIAGGVEIVDTSNGRFTNAVVRSMLSDFDLVIVDHAGLMSASDGRRAIDDWRVMASISNTFKEDALSSGVAILAASQINREGAGGGALPPKLDQLSQSDALAQDADVVVTMRALSPTVRVYSAEKNRNGEPRRWWAKYDVTNADYAEIDYETAQARIMEDQATQE